MGLIEQLRAVGDFEGTHGYFSTKSNEDERNEKLLENIEEGTVTCISKEVDSRFEDGGRWSNYEYTVYQLTEHNKTAFFEVMRERPGSETQDGMDCSYAVGEVYPHQVVKTVYKSFPNLTGSDNE